MSFWFKLGNKLNTQALFNQFYKTNENEGYQSGYSLTFDSTTARLAIPSTLDFDPDKWNFIYIGFDCSPASGKKIYYSTIVQNHNFDEIQAMKVENYDGKICFTNTMDTYIKIGDDNLVGSNTVYMSSFRYYQYLLTANDQLREIIGSEISNCNIFFQ